MTATLTAHGLFTFADGNAGHTVDLGSAPVAGDIDVFGIISVTVINSAGLGTQRDSHLNNDDVRTYTRTAAGGEGSTVGITTSGNFQTLLAWQRWRGLTALDTHALAVLDASPATSSPSVSSGALSASTELAVAFALGSNTALANQAGSWPAGWTPVDEGRLDSSTFGVYGASAYRLPAAQAGESVSLSWSGDAITNTHTGILTFTVTAAPPPTTDPAALLGRRRGGRR